MNRTARTLLMLATLFLISGRLLAQSTDVLVNDRTGELGDRVTQSETSIAIRPPDSTYPNGLLCAVWQDSAVPNDVIGFGSSIDRGQTWTDHGILPALPGTTNLMDPDVDYRALDQRFYFLNIRQGLVLHSSATCSPGEFTHQQVLSAVGIDKPMMAIDNWPGSPRYGTIYIVYWVKGSYEIKILRSTDNYQSPVTIAAPGIAVHGPWPTVAPTGSLYVAWLEWPSGPAGDHISIKVKRSDTGGASFVSLPDPVVNALNPKDTASPCSQPSLKSRVELVPSPQIEADALGRVHLVYVRGEGAPGALTDVSNVYYRRYVGVAWSSEVRLNQDGGTSDQFMPSLAVTDRNQVAVYWYDRRNFLNPVAPEFEIFSRASLNGGVTWQSDKKISDAQSPLPLPPTDLRSCGYMGDYNAAVADGTCVYRLWSDNRNVVTGEPDPDVWFEYEDLGGGGVCTASYCQPFGEIYRRCTFTGNFGECGCCQYTCTVDPTCESPDPCPPNACVGSYCAE